MKCIMKIPEEVCPPVLQEVPCPRMQLAHGTPLKTFGCVLLELRVEVVTLEHTVVVAAISDPGIIGFDFLKRHQCQVDLVSDELVIEGKRVSFSGVSSKAAEKVVLASITSVADEVIPANCESIVCAEVNAGLLEQCFISGNIDFEAKYHVRLAPSLCRPTQGTVPVRLLNPGSEDVHLCKGTALGQAELVESVSPFLQTENKQNSESEVVRTLEEIPAAIAELSWPESSDIGLKIYKYLNIYMIYYKVVRKT